MPSTSRASFWSRVRAAAARTAKKIGYRWRWDSGRAELSLEFPACGGRKVTVPPAAKRQVIGRMRAAVSEHYMSVLLSKPGQGKCWSRPPVMERVIASCGQESIFASLTGGGEALRRRGDRRRPPRGQARGRRRRRWRWCAPPRAHRPRRFDGTTGEEALEAIPPGRV